VEFFTSVIVSTKHYSTSINDMSMTMSPLENEEHTMRNIQKRYKKDDNINLTFCLYSIFFHNPFTNMFVTMSLFQVSVFFSYMGEIRRPEDEEPFISHAVLAVVAKQNVARRLVF
jgi:hypothetical protein